MGVSFFLLTLKDLREKPSPSDAQALPFKVVYKFTCLCDECYKVKTKRQLVMRDNEYYRYKKEKRGKLKPIEKLVIFIRKGIKSLYLS